jgi:sec-independent protein translocase protein TatA
MDVGPLELLIVLAIVLLIFGGSKLPQLARSLGRARSEFEKGTQEGHSDRPSDAPPAG